MAKRAQMDELIMAVHSISLESEPSGFDSDDVQILNGNLFRISESLMTIANNLTPKTTKVNAQTVSDKNELFIKITQLKKMIESSRCANKTQMLTTLQAINDRV